MDWTEHWKATHKHLLQTQTYVYWVKGFIKIYPFFRKYFHINEFRSKTNGILTLFQNIGRFFKKYSFSLFWIFLNLNQLVHLAPVIIESLNIWPLTSYPTDDNEKNNSLNIKKI